MVLSLDEAFARIRNVEKSTAASSDEISGFKRLLSVTQQLNSGMQKNASIDLKERDGYLIKLEEESRISQDQLKWKNEQFSHLEEAHRKLQTLLQVSKLEWQKEKSSLLDEISSLQGTLDARNCAAEILEAKLRMSDQALAHEASRRKVLEIENLELRSKFENVFLECRAVKSDIDQSTMKREDEIAELRILLRKNETLAIEMKFRIQQIEQESSDLLVSLKSNKEVSEKLKDKLHCAEQLNGKCGMNLTEEAGWNSQIDETLKEAEGHKILEVEEKNQEIFNLEQEMNTLCEKVEFPEKTLLQSMQVAMQPDENKKSEIQELRSQLEMETRCFDNLLEELKSHKQALLEINKENLLAQLENMCQQIGLLYAADVELMGRLSPLFEGESEPAGNLLSGDGVSNTFSLSRKNIQLNFDERIPLKELNVSSI